MHGCIDNTDVVRASEKCARRSRLQELSVYTNDWRIHSSDAWQSLAAGDVLNVWNCLRDIPADIEDCCIYTRHSASPATARTGPNRAACLWQSQLRNDAKEKKNLRTRWPKRCTVFTCVSYAEARNRYRLDVRLSVCLSVRPSVCPSHAGTVSKRLNILS